MASIVKITATTTIDVSSDVLNKEAGALVKEAIQQAIPVILDGLKQKNEPSNKGESTVSADASTYKK